MPEGPSIILLKEKLEPFVGKTIVSTSGNSKIEQNRLPDQKIISIKTWGKHLLVCFKGFTVRIHLLMFGTCLVNERKDLPVRLNLTFENGEINFYSCAIKMLEGDVESHYDFTSDVMNSGWDPKSAKLKLKDIPDTYVCDALLEQDIFSGVGNIIKNEVLYRIRIHPESLVGKLPKAKIKELIEEARHYSFQFLDWKRNFVLREHWLAHTKKTCLRCNLPFIRKHTGLKNRRSFFCSNCQILYT